MSREHYPDEPPGSRHRAEARVQLLRETRRATFQHQVICGSEIYQIIAMDSYGSDFVVRRRSSKKAMSAAVSGFAIQPRGLREKICTVSQPVSLATISALCSPPFIGAWKPMRGRFLRVASILVYSYSATNFESFRESDLHYRLNCYPLFSVKSVGIASTR